MSTRQATWPVGYDLLEFDELDSTNAQALRMAKDLVRPTWIRAARQTAGRGRSGRSWASKPGNLTATLLYRPKCSLQDAALRTFVAANALYDALARLVDPTRLSLKWPNDVLLDGGKVAGILLESEADGANVKWLAAGVGVNLSFAPDPDGEGTSTPVSLTDTVNVADFHALLAEAYSLEETRIVELGFGPFL